MPNIISFSFKNSQFRTVITNDEPWFCLSDICGALSIKVASPERFQLDAKGVTQHVTPTDGGHQKITFVAEPNLYRLIFRSNKDEAKKFQNWIFNEVIPSIRRTGQYTLPSTITAAQQSELQAIVADKSSGNGKHRAMMWSRFNRHFKIAKYSQLPVSQFDDAVAYMQAIPAFGDLKTEEDNADRIKKAFALAASVAAEVSRTVFDAVCSEEESDLRHSRWLFGCRFDLHSNQFIPYARLIDREACIVTLPELAKEIDQGSALMPSNDELVGLASACQQRLMRRVGINKH